MRLLAAIEPRTGRRLGRSMRGAPSANTRSLPGAGGAYPNAITIRLVQDNFNTHNASAFYEHLPAADAYALAQRFEFIYTPKRRVG